MLHKMMLRSCLIETNCVWKAMGTSICHHRMYTDYSDGSHHHHRIRDNYSDVMVCHSHHCHHPLQTNPYHQHEHHHQHHHHNHHHHHHQQQQHHHHHHHRHRWVIIIVIIITIVIICMLLITTTTTTTTTTSSVIWIAFPDSTVLTTIILVLPKHDNDIDYHDHHQ